MSPVVTPPAKFHIDSAYDRLLLSVRSVLELSESIGDEQHIVHSDNIDDLNAAYQEAYKILNHV